MKFGLATVIAASMVAFAAGPAASQSPSQSPWPQAQPEAAPSAWPQQQAAPPPAPQSAAPSPWDQQQQAAPPPQQQGPDPWSQPQGQIQGQGLGQGLGQGQGQAPPQDTRCLDQFMLLRKDVEKRGGAIQAASQRKEKPQAKEACGLFNAFTAAEKKMYAYAVKNATACSIPPQIIDSLKQSRAKSDDIRNRVCQAAAQGPPRAAAPSLSDALSAPIPDSGNIKTGRGTYDTLTGNPLGK
jgi:hypothetical protein